MTVRFVHLQVDFYATDVPFRNTRSRWSSMSPTARSIVDAVRARVALPVGDCDVRIADAWLPPYTDRSIRNALVALELEGALTWHRKTPGRPRVAGYSVTVHGDHHIWIDGVLS